MRKFLWGMMTSFIFVVIGSNSWAGQLPYVNFYANLILGNGDIVISHFESNDDGSAVVTVRSNDATKYVIHVDPTGTITAMETAYLVGRKVEGDLHSETLRYTYQPLHGEEALQALAEVTGWLEAPRVIILGLTGTGKLAAYEGLQFYHSLFFNYIPKTPTTWGGIKNEELSVPTNKETAERIHALKEIIKDANDGFGNGKVQAVPIMKHGQDAKQDG